SPYSAHIIHPPHISLLYPHSTLFRSRLANFSKFKDKSNGSKAEICLSTSVSGIPLTCVAASATNFFANLTGLGLPIRQTPAFIHGYVVIKALVVIPPIDKPLTPTKPSLIPTFSR